jgi:hypothetical protein
MKLTHFGIRINKNNKNKQGDAKAKCIKSNILI